MEGHGHGLRELKAAFVEHLHVALNEDGLHELYELDRDHKAQGDQSVQENEIHPVGQETFRDRAHCSNGSCLAGQVRIVLSYDGVVEVSCFLFYSIVDSPIVGDEDARLYTHDDAQHSLRDD